MKKIILLLFATVFIGVSLYSVEGNAHMSQGYGPGYGMGPGMMGGGGMMGGQGGFNGSGWGQRDSRVPSDEYRQNRNLNNQRVHREEIQRLHERIQQKRRELSSLYRSNTADKAEINKKVDELNNLERDLDDQVSSYDDR